MALDPRQVSETSQAQPSLAASLLQVIRKAPAEGLDVLATLAQAGHIDVQAPIDAGAPSLAQAVHQLLLDRKVPLGNPGNPLFVQLYSKAGLSRWSSMHRGALYGQRLPDGRSIPQAVFELAAQMSDAKSRGRSSENPRKMVESWFLSLLPSLPPAFLERHGGELLGSALDLGLFAASNALWEVVGPLALDRSGRPALLRARRHEQWYRYLKQHGEMDVELDDGRPLWEHLLEQSLATKKPTPFQRAFEQWFARQSDPAMRVRIPELAQARLVPPLSLTPVSQWVDMFRASGSQWLDWRMSRSKGPAWLEISLAHPDLAMFDALAGAPDLLSQLSQDQFKIARLASLVDGIASAASNEKIAAGIKRLDELLAEELPSGCPPIVSWLDPKRMFPAAAAALGEWSMRHQRAWWGTPEQRDEQSRRLAWLLLDGDQRKHEALGQWKDLCKSAPTPWLRVAMGFAGTISRKNAPLLSVDPAEGACVIQHPDGQAWLDGMVKVFSPKRRKLLMPWLEAALLEAHTAPANAMTSRSVLRL